LLFFLNIFSFKSSYSQQKALSFRSAFCREKKRTQKHSSKKVQNRKERDEKILKIQGSKQKELKKEDIFSIKKGFD